MEFTSRNEKDTYKLAAKIGRSLKPGDILALRGDLGSGKTTFVKGLAHFLDLKKPVTSPTFVLMKEYEIYNSNPKSFSRPKTGSQTSKLRKQIYLVHIDAYRMENEKDVESIGLLEYFDRDDAITAIEWPERIENILPVRTKWIKFEYINENQRRITIQQ